MPTETKKPDAKLVELTKLRPYDRNAKKHDGEQIDQICRSIERFGWTNPIQIDEAGVIIAGHGRYAAAKKLKLKRVPCVVISGLSDEERRALTLADNKIAENAKWDLEALGFELTSLASIPGLNLDLALTGFSAHELKIHTNNAETEGGLTDDDAAPPLEEKTRSQPGDIWLLGNHRVLCGDATAADSYTTLYADLPLPQMCITDPPYNVNYQSAAGSIKNDHMDDSSFAAFLAAFLAALFSSVEPGAAVYVFHADTEGLNFRRAFVEAGFKLSGCLIWRKESLVLGRSDYQWQHEPILYGWHPGASHRWYGGRKQTTMIEMSTEELAPFTKLSNTSYQVDIGGVAYVIEGKGLKLTELLPSIISEEKPKVSKVHPTMKPVPLLERLMKNNSLKGDVVIDPFLGSGSTLITAEKLGRTCYGMELDPRYCDVIVKRWQDYTGKEAVHGETGETFNAQAVG